MQYVKRCLDFTYNIYDAGNLPYCTPDQCNRTSQLQQVTADSSTLQNTCTSVFRSALTHTTHCTLHNLVSTLINISKYSLQNNNKTAKSDPNQIQELGQYNYVTEFLTASTLCSWMCNKRLCRKLKRPCCFQPPCSSVSTNVGC